MPTTVTGMLPEIKDYTPTFLYLYNESTGALVNAGGDAITIVSTGFYSASVDETISEYIARIDDSTGQIWVGWLNSSGKLQSDRPVSLTSLGGGARTVVITVNDGTTNLTGAFVRVIKVGDPAINLFGTTVSGVVTFNLDDGSYTVSITKGGYSYAGTTLVVDGTEAVTYSMAATSITPGTGSFTTGFLTAYDEVGTIEAGASVYCELTKAPVGDLGFSYDSALRTLTSDANGLVEIEGLIKGGTYRIWRGVRNSSPTSNNLFLIPTTAGSTYELPSHIGRE